jgi:uncharacterized protein
MSAVSQILKNFNLYIDGRGYAGNIDEVQLPALNIVQEDYRGGGMDAPLSIDMGMEKLEATFKVSKFDRDLITKWGVSAGSGVPLVLRGALESLDGTVKAVAVRISGSVHGLEFDTVTAGAKAGMTFKLSATSYKYEQDDETLIDIDILNMKRIIGGVDRLKEIRNAIGI